VEVKLSTKLSKTDVKSMLIDQSGISIYRNDFRIRPYGDKGFDWLNLDSKRIQNPSMAIGSEQINGRISIESEEKSGLKEKSARDGLYENASYFVLQRIADLSLNLLQKERFNYRQKRTRKKTNVIDKLFDFTHINEKMGLTIVLITHEMHVIREICDRVAVIEGGVILEEGSTVEVFTHPRENTTKEFISSVVSDNLPPEALEHLELHDQWIAGTAPLVRLKFTGQATDEPVVAGLVRRFNLDVSILFGGIDYIQNTSVGRLIVILNGDPENAQEGLDYIKTLPIESEVIGYVRANH